MKRLALILPAALLLASCAGTTSRKPAIEVFNDMRQQQKYYPQGESAFKGFDDGRAERRPIPGTRAVNDRSDDSAFYTGQANGMYVAENPVKITPALLQHGQARFNTYCSPCHGRAGNGKGIVGARSNWVASSLIDERVQGFADGDIFDVITHGRRSMPAYRYQVDEADRWAIISYVRALQRTANSKIDDVPNDLRTSLQ